MIRKRKHPKSPMGIKYIIH